MLGHLSLLEQSNKATGRIASATLECFFDRPGYDLASTNPGSFSIAPVDGMVDMLGSDYASTAAIVFGHAPDFAEIIVSVSEIEKLRMRHTQFEITESKRD